MEPEAEGKPTGVPRVARVPKDKCQAKVKTTAKAWPPHRCSIYNTVLHSTVPLTRSVDRFHETTLVFPFWVGGTHLLLFFPR